MANRGSRSTRTAPAEAPAEVTEPTADVAADTTTEENTVTAVAEPTTEPTTEPAADATPEKTEKPDISALKAAVDALIAGDVSDLEALNFDAIVAEYTKLDRAGKGEATRYLKDRSPELLESGEMFQARAVLLAAKAVKAEAAKGSGTRTPAAPVDPTEAFVARLASVQIAYALLAASKPEGVADDFAEKVQAAYGANIEAAQKYLAWDANDAEDKGDAPETNSIVDGAVKIASKKIATARRAYGPRHDVNKHLSEVFADKPSGTFLTAGEIAKTPTEEYGEKGANLSAITGRLKGKSDLPEGLSRYEKDGESGVLKA